MEYQNRNVLFAIKYSSMQHEDRMKTIKSSIPIMSLPDLFGQSSFFVLDSLVKPENDKIEQHKTEHF